VEKSLSIGVVVEVNGGGANMRNVISDGGKQ